jgi:hypothetical protein
VGWITGDTRGVSVLLWQRQHPADGQKEEPMTSHAGCPVHADFDPLSPTFLADPFAILASLPRETPVFYAPSIDYFVVKRYTDIEGLC